MSQEAQPYLEIAKAHPYLTAATLLYLALVALGNVKLEEETAVKWPRFASLWVVAQKTGLVLRGLLKPLLGIALPSAARQVVEQLWPGALTSQRNPVPPSSGSS
jgi:hypothetical protein